MITYGETIRGMQNVSPLLTYKFSNLNSGEMQGRYFLDFYKENSKGIEIIVADDAKIDPSDISEFMSDFTYPDTGEFAFTLKVFISTDGIKIREAYEVTKPNEFEVLFFIEENKDDWSKQVLFAKIGEKVKSNLYDFTHLSQNDDALKYINTLLSSESKLTFEILKELCENGKIEDKVTVDYILLKGLGGVLTVFSAPLKAVGWVVEKIGEAIDLLKIPERFWDDENENYVFTKENILNSLTIDTTGFVNQVVNADKSSIHYIIDIYGKANFGRQIQTFTSPISKTAEAYNAFITQLVEDNFSKLDNLLDYSGFLKQNIAALSGIWNGLVDFVSSTLKFIGTLAQTGFDIVNNWQQFLEIIDNITQSLSNINPSEIWEGIKLLYEQVKTYFKDDDGLNWVRIAYIVGYAIAFIGTMFIPIAGWVGKIAKVDKLIPDELLKMLKTSGETIAKQLNAQSRNAQLRVLQQCAELLEIFAKGKDEIVKFFTKLGDDIGKWFVKNSKTYRKVNNVVNEADLLKFIKANRIKGEIDVAFVLRISNKRKDLAESLLLSLKEVKEGKTIIQLIRYFKITDPPLPASLGNYQTRIWYTWKKMQIEKQIKRIKKLEEKAKKAFELRNEYRTSARQYMKDRKWANYLEEVEKNQEWEKLLERTLKNSEVDGNLSKAYEYIIQGSMKGRDDVDKLFKIK